MHVALPQQHVADALHLDLTTVFGLIQHAIADLNGTHVLADPDDLRPGKAPSDRRGGRDQDAAARSSFAVRPVGTHQNPVVEESDG